MNRLKEFFIISKYRWIEFFSYTVCGIEFYRNYSRFYWKNKEKNTPLPYQKDYYIGFELPFNDYNSYKQYVNDEWHGGYINELFEDGYIVENEFNGACESRTIEYRHLTEKEFTKRFTAENI